MILRLEARRAFPIAWLLAVLGWGGGPALAQSQKTLELDNEVVCWVNTEKISKRDVEARMGPVYYRLVVWRESLKAKQRWNEKTQAQFKKLYIPSFRDALREIVRERLMLQEAKLQKIEVDKERFRKRLNRTLDQLRKKGVLNKNGYTIVDVKKELLETMRIGEFRATLVNVLDLPTRPQVRAYYREHLGEFHRMPCVKIRRIQIGRFYNDNLGERKVRKDALQTAEELREGIVTYGNDFEDLAREKSDDEASIRKEGGLVRAPDGDEYIDPQPNPILMKALSGLKTGEVSKVFDSGRSWMFVKLEGRRPAGPKPLDGKLYKKIYDQLVEKITRRKDEEWFRQALEKSLVLDADQKPFERHFFFPNEEAPKERGGEKNGAKTKEHEQKAAAKPNGAVRR